MSDYYADTLHTLPLFRRTDPDTSKAAGEAAREFLGEHERLILEALAAGPGTKDEIAGRCGLSGDPRLKISDHGVESVRCDARPGAGRIGGCTEQDIESVQAACGQWPRPMHPHKNLTAAGDWPLAPLVEFHHPTPHALQRDQVGDDVGGHRTVAGLATPAISTFNWRRRSLPVSL